MSYSSVLVLTKLITSGISLAVNSVADTTLSANRPPETEQEFILSLSMITMNPSSSDIRLRSHRRSAGPATTFQLPNDSCRQPVFLTAHRAFSRRFGLSML